jgi:hypothetical protein
MYSQNPSFHYRLNSIAMIQPISTSPPMNQGTSAAGLGGGLKIGTVSAGDVPIFCWAWTLAQCLLGFYLFRD